MKPFDTLILTQFKYGKFNTPKGKATPSDRDNIKDTPMLNAIREVFPHGKKVILKDLVDLLKTGIKK